MSSDSLAQIALLGLDLVSTEALGTGEWQADRQRLMVKAGPAVHYFWPKDTVSAFVEADSTRQERLLERWLLGVRRGVPARTSEHLKGRVVPRLRPLAQFSLWELRRQLTERSDPEGGPAPELSVPHVPVGDGLGMHLGFEMAEDVSDVNAAVLAGWGRPLDEMLAVALETLRARTGGEPLFEVRSGLYASGHEDGHDAARMLLPELTQTIPLRGEPIFLAPRPGTLLVAGSEDDAGLMEMGRLGLELSQHPLAVSGTAFRRTASGKLEAWLPAPERPSFHGLRMARIPVQASLYELQKGLLEALAELEGWGEFVSPYVPFEHPVDGLCAAAVWVQGTRPLLPRAEYVVFVVPQPQEADARAVMVPWAEAVALPDIQVAPSTHHPERVAGQGFPSEETLARFEASAAAAERAHNHPRRR